jgi:hypothetical protein
MFSDWIDFAAVALLFIHAGVIMYGMRLFPVLDKETARGWTYFILLLCTIFISRLIYTSKALDFEDYPSIQIFTLGLTTILAGLYVHSKSQRFKQRHP